MNALPKTIAAAAILCGFGGTAHATPTIFFGEDLGNGAPATAHPNADAARADFFSNLTGVGTETFESFAPGTTAPIAATFSGAGTATLMGNGSIMDANSFNRFAISGANYFGIDKGNFSITFSSPIASFGFYGTDIGDGDVPLVLLLTGSNGSTTQVVPNNTDTIQADGSVLYYAFFDPTNTYTSVTFTGAGTGTVGGSDVFGFDDFSIGSTSQISAVPEPPTWSFVMLAFCGLGFLAYRRRHIGVKA
jgi:hypothetical protein